MPELVPRLHKKFTCVSGPRGPRGSILEEKPQGRRKLDPVGGGRSHEVPEAQGQGVGLDQAKEKFPLGTWARPGQFDLRDPRGRLGVNRLRSEEIFREGDHGRNLAQGLNPKNRSFKRV